MGMIPKSTKAEIKIGRFSVVRGFILLFSIILAFNLSGRIADNIIVRILVSVLCTAAVFILTGNSPGNPKKKFFFGLKSFILNLIEPKKFYGRETEQYIAFKQREDGKNAEKIEKKQKRQDRKAEKERNKKDRKSPKKKLHSLKLCRQYKKAPHGR